MRTVVPTILTAEGTVSNRYIHSIPPRPGSYANSCQSQGTYIMANYRLVTFPCIASLLALCAAFANSAPVASNLSAQAGLTPRLHSLLRATGALNLALQAAPAAPKEDDPLPDGKGKDITKKVCSGCHALSVVSQKRRTADEWDDILERMISKGLEASDDDLDKIHDYLVTALGTASDGSANAPPASIAPR